MNIEKDELNVLLFNFLETIHEFQQLENSLFKVNWQEIYILKIIQRDGSKNVGYIASILKVPLFQASRLVQRMVDKDLVIKTRDLSNHRVVFVDITKTGAHLINNIEDYHFKLIKSNFQVLTNNEFHGILTGLGKLKEILSLGGNENEG